MRKFLKLQEFSILKDEQNLKIAEMDAKMRPIYPGFIDAHCHFLWYGNTFFEANDGGIYKTINGGAILNES